MTIHQTEFARWLRRQGREPKPCDCGAPSAAREAGLDYDETQHAPDCAFIRSMDDLWNEFAEEWAEAHPHASARPGASRTA